jgi:hypothetical protein
MAYSETGETDRAEWAGAMVALNWRSQDCWTRLLAIAGGTPAVEASVGLGLISRQGRHGRRGRLYRKALATDPGHVGQARPQPGHDAGRVADDAGGFAGRREQLMTASPAVAQDLPGATPLPDAAGTPPTGAGPADGTIEEEPPERRRRKFLILFLLLLGFLALLGLAIWYLLFRQPIPIPVLPEIDAALDGVYGPPAVGVAVARRQPHLRRRDAGDQIARVPTPAAPSSADAATGLTGTEHARLPAADPLTAEIYVTDRPTGRSTLRPWHVPASSPR